MRSRRFSSDFPEHRTCLQNLALLAVADPRFKVHFSAIERWSREIWANAYADGTGFQVRRRVTQDTLKPQELASVYMKMTSGSSVDIIKECGPMGALAHAIKHFEISGLGIHRAVIWSACSP